MIRFNVNKFKTEVLKIFNNSKGKMLKFFNNCKKFQDNITQFVKKITLENVY